MPRRRRREYGTKTDKIIDMIADKLNDNREQLSIKTVESNSEYKKLLRNRIAMDKKIKLLERQMVDNEKEIKNLVKKYGLDFDRYYRSGKWSDSLLYRYLDNAAIMDSKELEELRDAQDAYDLGQRSKAQKVWDKYIKKYQLGGN